MTRVAGDSQFYRLAVLNSMGVPTNNEVFLPSVSSVTRLLAKPALIPWAYRLGVTGVLEAIAEVGVLGVPLHDYDQTRKQLKELGLTPDQTMQRGMERGKRVHQLAEDLASEITTVAKIKRKLASFGEEAPYVQGLISWWEKETADGMEVLASEKVVVSLTHRFAGTLDLYAIRDGERILTDFKTGKAIYPEHWIQLSGYWLALEEEGEALDRMSIVLLTETGMREEFSSVPRREEFLGLLKVFQYMQSIGTIPNPERKNA